MNAMEKVAWLELSVSLLAIALATALLPWLGNGAVGAFGLLGLLGFTAIMLRQRGQKVVVDERDREISRRSMAVSVFFSWYALTMALVAIIIGFGTRGQAVPVVWLNWLVWTQTALCFGVKGLVGILSYRWDAKHAT